MSWKIDRSNLRAEFLATDAATTAGAEPTVATAGVKAPSAAAVRRARALAGIKRIAGALRGKLVSLWHR
jgi:hypothetical protein